MQASLVPKHVAMLAMAGAVALVVPAFDRTAAQPANPRSSNPLSIAYTFTHVRARCPDTARNARQPGAARRQVPSTDPTENLALNYDVAAIRATAQSAMQTMRAEGATALRLVVWFSDVNLPLTRQSPLGLLPNQDGHADPRFIANLTRIAEDARADGYRRLYVVLGPLGRASPKCRMHTYGDCFEASDMDTNWRLMAQVIGALQPPSAAGMQILFDLGPEMCPGEAATPLAAANMDRYDAYMVSHYTQTYRDNDFFVSCGGGPRLPRALDGVTQFYLRQGVRPALLDAHVYSDDEATAESVLRQGQAAAQRLGAPFDVLETHYDSQPVFEAVRRLRQAGEVPSLRTVGIWPNTREAACAISLTAPFSLAGIERALGEDG